MKRRLGGECFDPAAKPSPIFRMHGDEFHAHADFGSSAAYHGASANLTRGRVHQHLDVRPGRRRIRRSNKETSHAQVSKVRDKLLLGRLPGEKRTRGGRQARVIAKLRHRTIQWAGETIILPFLPELKPAFALRSKRLAGINAQLRGRVSGRANSRVRRHKVRFRRGRLFREPSRIVRVACRISRRRRELFLQG